VIENNGVYGLTKGQFSASADPGSKAKYGEVNTQQAIDPVLLALSLGATFVARSFSGDKSQLVPILKAGLTHRGFALVDVISPCVTFNDHEGSTKSYRYTRQNQEPIVEADFVPPASEITADYASGTAAEVTMHDGSIVRFTKIPEGYDPSDRDAVVAYLRQHQSAGAIPTGLLYLDPDGIEMHAGNKTVGTPLTNLPYEQLCPGAAALDALQKSYR
jgi:2-oxoglutarate ferredoxin oxidoreductase subunit beta